jgi:hypothetical protein
MKVSHAATTLNLPPPLWGRVGVGGKRRTLRLRLTPLPALRADLPHKRRGKEGWIAWRLCA